MNKLFTKVGALIAPIAKIACGVWNTTAKWLKSRTKEQLWVGGLSLFFILYLWSSHPFLTSLIALVSIFFVLKKK